MSGDAGKPNERAAAYTTGDILRKFGRDGFKLAKVIKGLLVELDQARDAARWIPVEERMPAQGVRVMVWGRGLNIFGEPYGWTNGEASWNGEAWASDWYSVAVEITHWHALLDPPETAASV